MTRKAADILFYAAVGAAACVLAGLSLLRHYRFASTQDLALFEQLLWNVRQGHGLWTTISGNEWLQFPHHFFGEHVAPILYLLAYPAGWTRGPDVLLIVQALVVALAAIPAARIVAAETNLPAAGLAAGLAWLALPGLWGAVLFDFHMESFGALFLFLFWLALRSGRPACWVWAVLYAACKEDAPFYLAAVACIGGYRAGRRRLGWSVALASAAYGLAAVFWIQPAFAPAGEALLGRRLALPAHAGEIGQWLAAQFFSGSRWQALGGHLLAFGLLPLAAGSALLPPVLGGGLLWLSNDYEQAHGLLHYPLTLYPLLFLAAAGGLRRLMRWVRGWSPAARRAWYGAVLAVCACGIGWAWGAEYPTIVRRIGTGNTEALRRAPSVLACIPDDGAVCAVLTAAPHLARRRNLEILMGPPTHAEWIATRLDGIVHPFSGHQDWLFSTLLSDASDYGITAVQTNFLAVFKRGQGGIRPGPLREALSSTFQAEYMAHQTGRAVRDGQALNGLAHRFRPGDRDGYAVFGRYRDVAAGTYRIAFRIRARAAEPGGFAYLDVTEQTPSGRVERAGAFVSNTVPEYADVILDATLCTGRRMECRIRKTGAGTLWADQIRWERLEERPPRDGAP